MKKKVTPLLTQMRPAYFSVDCGMAYIIRVCDGNFAFCLTTDAEKEKAQLYLYDECVCEMPYQECCGLSFILKNAAVRLEHIRCVSE